MVAAAHCCNASMQRARQAAGGGGAPVSAGTRAARDTRSHALPCPPPDTPATTRTLPTALAWLWYSYHYYMLPCLSIVTVWGSYSRWGGGIHKLTAVRVLAWAISGLHFPHPPPVGSGTSCCHARRLTEPIPGVPCS